MVSQTWAVEEKMNKEDMGITARVQLEVPIDRLYELLALIKNTNKQTTEPSGEVIAVCSRFANKA
jgi:hypothetical protein